jgi:hypothetical protein
VSEMSAHTYGHFFGRGSECRREARRSGLERLLPPPPKVEDDPTLGRLVERAAGGGRRGRSGCCGETVTVVGHGGPRKRR